MISKCRINQEKVSMDGYNILEKKKTKNQLDSKGHGKRRQRQAAINRKQGLTQIPNEMRAEVCEAWRADNSWELRKGVNQAAAFHTPGNIQQGWQQMTVIWKQKSHSLLIFSIIILANCFFLNYPHPWQYQCDTEFSLWKPQWGNLILWKMGVLSP